jgi:hypothetical protein
MITQAKGWYGEGKVNGEVKSKRSGKRAVKSEGGVLIVDLEINTIGVNPIIPVFLAEWSMCIQVVYLIQHNKHRVNFMPLEQHILYTKRSIGAVLQFYPDQNLAGE